MSLRPNSNPFFECQAMQGFVKLKWPYTMTLRLLLEMSYTDCSDNKDWFLFVFSLSPSCFRGLLFLKLTQLLLLFVCFFLVGRFVVGISTSNSTAELVLERFFNSIFSFVVFIFLWARETLKLLHQELSWVLPGVPKSIAVCETKVFNLFSKCAYS